MMAYRALFGGLLAAALAACGPKITITDDLDFTWDFELTLDRFHDNLHEPYVRGAEMTVYVTSDDDNEDYRDWTVESADPTIFSVTDDLHDDGTSLVVHGIAANAGDTELIIKDRHGDVVGSGDVRVRIPNRIELDAHGYLILGRDDEARVGEVRMMEQGIATYMVKYFADGLELHGNGVLSTEPDPVATNPVTAVDEQSYLFENREWLRLEAGAVGTQNLQLFADGEKVQDQPIVVVPESDIADVVVLAQSEKKAKDGQWLVLLAQAYDGMGRRVFGIDYDWMVDGQNELGVGDLYKYEFKKKQLVTVSAQRNGHSDSVQIHSDMGYVSSSNNVGCSTAGGTAFGLPALAFLGLIGVRRRRNKRN